VYWGTSHIRNSPPPWDHHRALCIARLQGPRSALVLMSEVPMYRVCVPVCSRHDYIDNSQYESFQCSGCLVAGDLIDATQTLAGRGGGRSWWYWDLPVSDSLRIPVYLVIYDSGQVFFEHLLLSWKPFQRGDKRLFWREGCSEVCGFVVDLTHLYHTSVF